MARERAAAGGIVWRRAGAEPRPEVLLIHRPAYDDWSFPKGKADPGEALAATAVREIAEETSLRVRLGHPLGTVSYPVSGGTKTVSYWSARPVGQGESDAFVPNREVDEIRWTGLREAASLLTYDHDQRLLETFLALRERQAHRTRTLIVLRHATAVERSGFAGSDSDRPLTTGGTERATQLIPLLSAYGIVRVVSSPATRCMRTVEPYANSISTFLQIDDRLGEDTRSGQVRRSVEALLDHKRPVVLCTHRPTLPWVFDAIGTDTQDLSPGEAVVVHHRKGKVLTTERLR